MPPFFDPGRINNPDIPIYIAGVNQGLAHLAGETADGFHIHPLHTARYVREALLPAIERGAGKASRKRADITLTTTAFVVTSPEEDLFVRAQIAFYASTPTYRPVMALHGWEEIARQLSALASQGKWGDMPGLIDDEMLTTFAVVTDESHLAAALKEKYAGLADRIALYLPFMPGEKDSFWEKLVKDWQMESDDYGGV